MSSGRLSRTTKGLAFTWRYPIDRGFYSLVRRRLDGEDEAALSDGERRALEQGLERAY